jgi:NAD(P)-dependent dehydrogenase (short-subunit alcohol dehydrogenase family)
MSLAGKVAIVTGSSRGIGKAIALRFAREGAKLVINCRSSVPEAEAVAHEIRVAGSESIVVPVDVGERANADRLVSSTIKAFGRIDVLVSNAGIIIDRPFIESTDEDWRAAMHSNLDPSFYLVRACLPYMMKQRSGRVLATGSVIAEKYDFGPNKMAVCTAAKAGLLNMLRAVAVEVAPFGITVNAVSPGYIATEMFATIDAAGAEAALKMIPMGRYGAPSDIANAMAFLASDQAAYITGQTIRVNGGMSMG